ncbi:hypothetical protein PM082_014712 [Marasmius tenuissimus]|nr:hypothetical protein PM082_014712 [Marasmius tenuissimus]
MKLCWALQFNIFLLLYLFRGMRAYQFDLPPATITVFQPQTITWYRGLTDTGAGTLALIPEDGDPGDPMGKITFDGTQGQGPLIFTATTVGPLTVEGILIVLEVTGLPSIVKGPPDALQALMTERMMVVSPVGTVEGTTPSLTSSAPPSLTTDSNTSSSDPPAPSVAADSNISGSNSSRAKIIGASVGGAGFLVVLVAGFVFLRRRRNQRVQDFEQTAAVICPFPPKAPILDHSRGHRELSSIPTSNRKVVQGFNNRVTGPTAGKQSISPQQPHTERDGSESGETSTLGDDNRYRAMQTEIRLLMQRMEIIEGTEEAPPEYVSAYESSR